MSRHVAVGLAVALPLCLAAAPSAGLDAWTDTDVRDALRAEEDRAAELADSLEDLCHRKAAAAAVLARFEDGRVSLAGAAAELEAVYRPRDGYMHALRSYFPGATDRERFARWAVELLQLLESWEPGRHTVAMVRAEVELAALYPPRGDVPRRYGR